MVAGIEMTTNSVYVSSGVRGTFLIARFDESAGSRNEFSTGVRHIVESDLFVVIGVD